MQNSQLKYRVLLLLCIVHCASCISLFAQEKDLGDKEYVIIKDYKPVLAESNKISDTPEGDRTSSVAPKMEYSLASKKLETNFEAGVIKAVKIKDETISKLYPTLVKLGIGNNTTYYGELFYNALRSKTGQIGVHLNHLSGEPMLTNYNSTISQDASYSNNAAEVYGKYFLDNATFSSSLGYDRRVVHYYGLPSDTIAASDDTKQRFNNINFAIGMKSNRMDNDKMDCDANFNYHTLNDLFDVTENNFTVWGGAGKKVSDNYYGLTASFDYFKKSRASFEKVDLYSDQSRNIVMLSPYLSMDKDKVHLKLGLNLSVEKNIEAKARIYPDVNITVPIAEHIIYIFADVTGNLQKVNYRTLTDENPFTTPAVKLKNNQSNNIIIDGGVKGNFSSNVSFNAMVKYNKFSNMPLFYNDTVHYAGQLKPNTFNILYDDGTMLDLHAELTYRNSEKLTFGLSFDQYSYNMEVQQKAWHKPMNETKLFAKYNLQDKIIANITMFFRGKQYAPISVYDSVSKETLFTPTSLKGYADINLGVEYRYSKVLSFYGNLNNLAFVKYYQWYNYPSQKMNALVGLTYSF